MSKMFQPLNDKLYRDLVRHHPDQIKEILAQRGCDIAPSFLGFVATYWHLAQLIPEKRTVYDLGCCSALQAWFFRNHKRYVGVDLGDKKRLELPNTEHHVCSIEEFIVEHEIAPIHFAICNYVPPWGADNEKLVRDNFKHLYVYYPKSEDTPFDEIEKKIGAKTKC